MHTENTSNRPSGRHGRHPLHRATQWAGRLLCLSLAVSMVGAAVETLAHPAGSWWQYTWFLAPALLVGWVVLRVLEKRHAGLEGEEREAEVADVGLQADLGEQELAGR
ncbi:hypothetical protein [Streptomyces sp. H27-C3]|uniref:hypothetical protein n=1 Tax=Streptomyces sp. H27-C3 TaxID=3046305 RepID=UPI0024BB49F4|nr:hypothetical protein [Streptomyces sp. H27-C3]MDJ0460719.1 hypothetical protein [Streptomyces sp. H27-C3]